MNRLQTITYGKGFNVDIVYSGNLASKCKQVLGHACIHLH